MGMGMGAMGGIGNMGNMGNMAAMGNMAGMGGMGGMGMGMSSDPNMGSPDVRRRMVRGMSGEEFGGMS